MEIKYHNFIYRTINGIPIPNSMGRNIVVRRKQFKVWFI